MKRHDALIRKLLEHVECYGTDGPMADPEIPGYTPAQVGYHLRLCGQAGFLNFVGGALHDLLWEGHEELARLRQGNR